MTTTIRWHKNSHHPEIEAFHHPDICDLIHDGCGQVWRDHGWIDRGDGSFVCPGDLVTTFDDGSFRVEDPGAYVIIHSSRLVQMLGKWGLPPWGDEGLGGDVDCAPLIQQIFDDYEALVRLTPTLLVDALADALALPERTCVADRAVDL